MAAAAATHALCNPNLIREIIQHLSPRGTKGDVTRSNIRALACCSRVNKTFSVNALDFLWEQLDSLLPVLKLLPSFVLKERHLQDELTDFSDDEEDTETDMDDDELIYDWARLKQYAERVRLLGRISESSTLTAVLSLLYYHNGGRPILPRLECLDWRITSTSSTGILALVPPSIRTLTIVFSNVTIDFVDDTFEDDPRHIGVDGTLWRALSSLSALEAIEGNFKLVEDLPEGEEGFFALREVALCGRVRDVNRLINTISSRHLESFSYQSHFVEENLTTYLILLTTVCTKLGSFLRVFKARITFDAASVASLDCFGRIIQPLFSLSTLENITFMFYENNLPLSDKDMREIAKAFLGLKTFTIITYRMHEIVPSIEALMEFARHCPRLEYLRLPAIHFANLSSRRKFRHTSHGLDVL
ncbi:uncharacterized protein LAESUDRAFT_750773 [Laetiporus sulphureus 93-53]|uniref:F-box domain-containing protein n=1 Tax=Laetiporus sulphureus 93-53 TaxID=1314785 RepID=A0A165DKA5_9APHY|nr:uncharacterized protein LAESUDRAFT_750773 [Laetiporus sulphureus 93-53]KZT05069.1 hypothetical protein LAESUDRAFT_750773 [Laetiporus sulphureus 93-53]